MKNKIIIVLLMISVALNILIITYTLRIDFQDKSILESYFRNAVSDAEFQLSSHIMTHQSNIKESSPELISAISNIDKLGAIAFIMKIPDSQALYTLAQVMATVPDTSSAYYLEVDVLLIILKNNVYDSQAYTKLNEITKKIIAESALNVEGMQKQP